MNQQKGHLQMDDRWLVAAMVLPILYVLSPGPLFWLAFHSGIDFPNGFVSNLETFLHPLEVLYSNVKVIQIAYDAYFELLNISP